MNDPELEYSQVTQWIRMAEYPNRANNQAVRIKPKRVCGCDKWKPNSAIFEGALVYAALHSYTCPEVPWTHCPWCGLELGVE